MPSAIIAVNLRGLVNASAEISETLHRLNLYRRYNATILPDTESSKGMLQKVRTHVAWSSLQPDLAERLLVKRGRKAGWTRLAKEDLPKLGYSSFSDLAKAIVEGKLALNKQSVVKPTFTLSPPRGGFKRSSRRLYTQRGVLGENPELPKLIDAMV